MKKFLILFFSLLWANFSLKAQQAPYFSTYLVNPSIVNSSLSSLYNNNNVVLVYRNQWANYNPTNLSVSSESPSTGILSLNLKNRDKSVSFGMNIITDNLGPKEVFNLSPYLSISKKINNSYFSFGVSPSFKSTTLNFSSLIFVNPSDPFNIERKQTQSKPDLGVGVSFYNDKILLSLSAKNLTQPSFDFGINDLQNTENINLSFLGKYLIEIDRDLNVEPYLLFRSDLKSFTFDLSALATYKENMSIGASYRYDEAIVGFLGYHFLKKNKLFVGYSFDYIVHNVKAKAPISHELIVKYDLPTPQLKKPIRTPRFFY
tara:strand:- start:1645 stop:2595 length:951 start_codon:yes stop_codon:yes gene_type:complete